MIYDVALVLLGVAGVGICVVAIRSNMDLARHIAEESAHARRRAAIMDAHARHRERVTVELASLVNTEPTGEPVWTSGRTMTRDGVTHAIPAGFFAVTVCGEAVELAHPLCTEVPKRYGYDPPGKATTCLTCLGEERGC